jgi:hypothetical protein
VKLVRLTSGKEFSSWPSVCATEARQGYQDRSRGKKGSQESLTTIVLKEQSEQMKIGFVNLASNQSSEGAIAITENFNVLNVESGHTHSTLTCRKMDANGADQTLKPFSGQAAPANPSTDGSRQESWATPATHDGTTGTKANSPFKSLVGDVEKITPLTIGKLNPRWVETLMGLPVGWTMPSCASPVTIAPTSYASLAMESCPPPQSELFEF